MAIEHAIVAAAKKRGTISEDAYAVAHTSGEPFVASVVDGRGFHARRHEVADLAQFIASELVCDLQQDANPDMLPKWFDEVQDAVEHRFPNIPMGASAACLIVDRSRVLRLAHVGNCRLFRYAPEHFEGAERLTKDHTPGLEKEKRRLEGFCQTGNFRVIRHGQDIPLIDVAEDRLHFLEQCVGYSRDSLSYTRGFGHARFRPALTHEPEICTFELPQDTVNIFALCSHGGSRIVRHVFRRLQQMELDATVTLEMLSQMAKDRIDEKPKGPRDDTTIIFFKVLP
ncbi:MAG: hypothetical protein NTX72_06010 [Candidatus Uhrbacteria bacterium]|nr:hypothetical protein [Candidatus Uhrbacteria bacterium]